MSIHSLPTVPLDPAVHHRLLVEASRRCRDGEDVRAVMARLVERSVAAVLGQLEQEDVDVHSRHCRCERCVPPPRAMTGGVGSNPNPTATLTMAAPARFADGTMPGTPHRHHFTELLVEFGRRRCVCGELEPGR